YDDDEEDEDEEEEGGPSRRYDDDEDEEEEEEDEDVCLAHLPKARKKRRKVNRFIDEEAMVDDDEEEEEDEEEGFVEGQDEDFDELARETLDSRAHRELDRRRDEDSMDAEALAATMKARYGRSEFSRGAYRGDVEHIPQSMLMPSVADPKLWLCQVREGREKDVVFTILRKAIDRESTAGALDIYSVFARDSLKGYIYIEARQQAAVQAALDGVNNVFISKLRLVPVDEMVDCLTIKAKDQNLDNVHWFRVKRGKYAGDLGQVIQITENGETMLCRLVPRLEIGREGVRGPGAQKRKKNEPRAPQKLFNPMDHKGEVRKDRDYYIYNNEYFDREGYLEKNLKVSSVETVNVNPSLEEIGMFSGGTADKADLTHVANLAATRVATDYHIGEPVKITAGAMMGITGVVASIQHDILGIKPDSAYGSTLPSIVRVAASEVQKTFNVGDSVKVVKGKHEGAGGLIVVIDDNIITILDEGTKETIEVLSDYVRTTTDVGVIQPRTSPYDVGDLVFLQNDVAVVTKAERDQIFVLTQFGQTLRVQAQQIRSKRDSRSAIANDANRNPISAGTTVDVLDSDGRGDAKYTGTVQHIYRAFVFVKVVDLVENGGFVVAKAQNVVDKNAGKNGNSYSSPYDSYQTRNSFGGGGNRGGMGGFGGRGGGGGGGRGRGGGRGNFDPLIGQTVTIATGTFKGYLGIVKEVIDNQARVELHTASRVVTVDKTKVLRPGETRLPGAAGGRSDNPWGPPSSSISSYGDKWTSSASKTPMHGSKTPMHGSRTPFHGIGGRTPAHGDGGRTPGWDSGRASGSGSNTVDLGSRSTAAWDAGSKTPGHGMSAWDAGSRTPGHRAYGLDLDEPDNDGYGNSYDRRPYGDDSKLLRSSCSTDLCADG
ncbi:uncharacterized protein EV422DRAFT_610602, partial [Fimicolochytrium jonesii]|uniref:uncharacterized protein n=1 Tax=Fimicolochytrium jonesii TaxID=1396493 RepID=UPI0022FEFBA5